MLRLFYSIWVWIHLVLKYFFRPWKVNLSLTSLQNSENSNKHKLIDCLSYFSYITGSYNYRNPLFKKQTFQIPYFIINNCNMRSMRYMRNITEKFKKCSYFLNWSPLRISPEDWGFIRPEQHIIGILSYLISFLRLFL